MLDGARSLGMSKEVGVTVREAAILIMILKSILINVSFFIVGAEFVLLLLSIAKHFDFTQDLQKEILEK